MRVHLLHTNPKDLPADFWTSKDCELLVVKHWGAARTQEVQWLQKNLPDIPQHVWLASSGTLSVAGESKWIALSKQALLTSAEAVNQHLNAQSSESWGLTLPLAHVGGLGIVARAHLLGQKISTPLKDKWNPLELKSWQGELLSLVPTQVHDLVVANVMAPKNLRVVVVGGDRLSPELRLKGQALGWPLYPSYGLSECCSQVATYLPEDQDAASFLPHITPSISSNGKLVIDSPALFTGKAKVGHGVLNYVERASGPWETDDLAEITSEGKLKILGRADLVLKIKGEKVELHILENQLKFLEPTLTLVAIPDVRNGFNLWGISEHEVKLEQINSSLLPHQKLSGIKVIDQLPRSELGKVKRGELLAWLLEQLSV